LSVNRAFLSEGAACVVRSFHWQRGKHSIGKISERTEKHGDVFVLKQVSLFCINHIYCSFSSGKSYDFSDLVQKHVKIFITL